MRYELSDFEWGAIKAIIRDRIEDGDRARAAAIASLPTALSGIPRSSCASQPLSWNQSSIAESTNDPRHGRMTALLLPG
jgi:hypothetical protein